MRKSFIILMFISLQSFAQPWLKYYQPWTQNTPGSVKCDYDNGYLFSIVGVNYSPFNQHQIIQKIDDNGDLKYHFILGNGLNEGCRTDLFTLDTLANQFYAGSIWSQSLYEDPILLKLDSCKNKVWCTRLNNNPSTDFFWDVVVTQEGNIIALSIQNDEQNMDAFHIHKFTPDGRQIWRKELASVQQHPGIWDPDPVKLLLMPDGGVLVTGICYWPNPGDSTGWYYIRSMLVKADSAGNEEWFYAHGIDDYVYSLSLVSSYYNGSIYTDGAGYPENLSYSTPHFFKHDMNGNLLYDTRIFIPDSYDRTAKGNSLMSCQLNNHFYAGVVMFENNSTSDERPALVEVDTFGVVQDFFMPDLSLSLNGSGLPEITNDSKVLVPGVIYATSGNDTYMMRLLIDSLRFDSIPWSNFNYDSLCEEPIINHTISLDSCLIVVSNDDYKPPVRSTSLELIPYPVPVENQLVIKHSNSLQFRDITLMFYNTLGNLIETLKVN
ncbi:MAG TPA: hypothetical protein VK212_04055, partial [Lentimicrobium sp.]|nr:hypothetical protein [Lentimicrobium sp.]